MINVYKSQKFISLEEFLTVSETKQECPLLPLWYNIALGEPANTIRQEK